MAFCSFASTDDACHRACVLDLLLHCAPTFLGNCVRGEVGLPVCGIGWHPTSPNQVFASAQVAPRFTCMPQLAACRAVLNPFRKVQVLSTCTTCCSAARALRLAAAQDSCSLEYGGTYSLLLVVSRAGATHALPGCCRGYVGCISAVSNAEFAEAPVLVCHKPDWLHHVLSLVCHLKPAPRWEGGAWVPARFRLGLESVWVGLRGW